MPYLVHKKIALTDLLGETNVPLRVVIAEPEVELFGIYGRHLDEHGFSAHHCAELDSLLDSIAEIEPHALVISLHYTQGLAYIKSMLGAIKRSYPQLRLITLGKGSEHSEIRDIMDLGVSGHINRSLTRPLDVAMLVKTILYH